MSWRDLSPGIHSSDHRWDAPTSYSVQVINQSISQAPCIKFKEIPSYSLCHQHHQQINQLAVTHGIHSSWPTLFVANPTQDNSGNNHALASMDLDLHTMVSMPPKDISTKGHLMNGEKSRLTTFHCPWHHQCISQCPHIQLLYISTYILHSSYHQEMYQPPPIHQMLEDVSHLLSPVQPNDESAINPVSNCERSWAHQLHCWYHLWYHLWDQVVTTHWISMEPSSPSKFVNVIQRCINQWSCIMVAEIRTHIQYY